MGDHLRDAAEKKLFHRCPDCDKPLEPCGSCPQCGEYPDSPCHKAYVAWGGWQGPAPMWDTFSSGWQAATAALQAEKDALEGALRECVRVFGRINRGLLDHEISAEVYAVELNSKAALSREGAE